ncbi:MAG: glycosyltransferase family 2 protein, partial [Alphaproteobacteria bacterium]|nr:glycosyltransferase family 2 protein [Alphaproteobacteria bacterium]
MSGTPTISVIIATYNRSAVLRFAIESVLAQTFRDFELLVIGDRCTDDSEAVVRGFADPRVRWENLAEAAGSQSGPNNRGLSLARGRYVAYLGHDDLWHADHLATLLHAIEAERADLVFAISEEIGPPSRPTRGLIGLMPHGSYEFSLWAPPSSWLHRRDVVERAGPWRDHRTIVLPVDVDMLSRIHDAGLRIVPVAELTVFKFTSVLRTHAYRDPGAAEQRQWWDRLRNEPDLRYRELLAVVAQLAADHPAIAQRFMLPSRTAPGEVVERYRTRRGLPPAAPRAAAGTPATPLYADRVVLRYLNAEADVAPDDDRRALQEGGEMPEDGLFVGLNWHSLEGDGDGLRWRWIDRDAQLVVTRPTGRRRRLRLELSPGPGLTAPNPRLQLTDSDGVVVAETRVAGAGPVVFDLALAPGPGAV